MSHARLFGRPWRGFLHRLWCQRVSECMYLMPDGSWHFQNCQRFATDADRATLRPDSAIRTDYPRTD